MLFNPMGKFKFLRCPQGFIGAGDKYNYEVDRAIEGVEDTGKVVDDIATIIFYVNLIKVIEVLECCRRNGITLSPEKFKFAETEVKYVSYIIGHDGFRADPEKNKSHPGIPQTYQYKIIPKF